MKKFLLCTIGFTPPTPEIMGPWMEWFGSLKEIMVNQVGLTDGKEIGTDGSVTDLPMDISAFTGFVTINAASMDDAIAIAKKCPAVTSTRVYEIREG